VFPNIIFILNIQKETALKGAVPNETKGHKTKQKEIIGIFIIHL
jgi:hypothetical protein